MKKLLMKISIFGTGFILIIISLSKLVTVDVNAGYKRQIADLVKRQPKYLMFGDSHSHAIKQENLDEDIFNFSFGSDSWSDIYLKLEFCIQQSIPVRTVLLQCDQHMFSEYRHKKNNSGKTILISNFSRYCDVYNMNPVHFFMNRYVFKKFPILEPGVLRLMFQKKIQEFRRPNNGTPVAGRKWHELSEEERISDAKAKAKLYYRPAVINIYDSNLAEIFYKILSICETNGIEVIGVRFPLTEEYIGVLSSIDLTSVEQVYANSSIKLLDFRNRIKEARFFKDEDHLNDQGAKIFVQMLVDELSSLNSP